MKNLIFVFVFSFGLTMLSGMFLHLDNFRMSEYNHSFGTIEKDSPVTHTFTIFNEAETPLLIKEVKTTCGCTVAEYTKEPIMSTEKGSITVKYNAAKKGKFSKPVKVYTNAQEDPIVLTIEGEVR